MRGRGVLKKAVLGLGLLALVACDTMPLPETKPRQRPAGLVKPAPPPPTRSDNSLALEAYYKRVEANLLTQGLLRTGGGDIDTPYSDTDILRNFDAIALHEEYARNAGFKPSDGAPGRISRWVDPVRVAVEFDDLVPAETRERDTAAIRSYLARLSRVTGHPISLVSSKPNFLVQITTADSKDETLARAKRLIPDMSASNEGFFLRLPRPIQCFVLAAGKYDNPYKLDRAVALIRAENTDLQRRACIHEEIAQGLGLFNDSPQARPSIFNDDEEFALLTTHDEELLRLLYNPALAPGMDADTARMIARRILLGRPGPV